MGLMKERLVITEMAHDERLWRRQDYRAAHHDGVGLAGFVGFLVTNLDVNEPSAREVQMYCRDEFCNETI